MGIYFSAYTASVRTMAQIDELRDNRVPLLVEAASWQIENLRERIWRLENMMLEEKTDFADLPSWEDMTEAKVLRRQKALQLLREYLSERTEGLSKKRIEEK